MANLIHSPSHYTKGSIEAIDYIEAKLGEQGFRAYCLGNVLKYTSRWQDKDGIQDLRKAQVYLQWAIEGTALNKHTPEFFECGLPDKGFY